MRYGNDRIDRVRSAKLEETIGNRKKGNVLGGFSFFPPFLSPIYKCCHKNFTAVCFIPNGTGGGKKVAINYYILLFYFYFSRRCKREERWFKSCCCRISTLCPNFNFYRSPLRFAIMLARVCVNEINRSSRFRFSTSWFCTLLRRVIQFLREEEKKANFEAALLRFVYLFIYLYSRVMNFRNRIDGLDRLFVMLVVIFKRLRIIEYFLRDFYEIF